MGKYGKEKSFLFQEVKTRDIITALIIVVTFIVALCYLEIDNMSTFSSLLFFVGGGMVIGAIIEFVLFIYRTVFKEKKKKYEFDGSKVIISDIKKWTPKDAKSLAGDIYPFCTSGQRILVKNLLYEHQVGRLSEVSKKILCVRLVKVISPIGPKPRFGTSLEIHESYLTKLREPTLLQKIYEISISEVIKYLILLIIGFILGFIIKGN